MELKNVRHNWPEPAGFRIDRPEGGGEYILIHFHTSVELYMDGRWQTALPGTLIMFGPDTGHSFISAGPLLHDWLHLTGAVREEMEAFGLKVDVPYIMTEGRRITELFAKLESEFFGRGAHWESYVRAVFNELWISVARQQGGKATQPVQKETADRLQELRAEMILHPEYPWTNAMMARQVNLSESRLYPLYKRLFSISPGQDLILMRVEKAKNMLSQGTSVARTAELVGYSSVYHFIRQFRQVIGVTPGKWTER